MKKLKLKNCEFLVDFEQKGNIYRFYPQKGDWNEMIAFAKAGGMLWCNKWQGIEDVLVSEDFEKVKNGDVMPTAICTHDTYTYILPQIIEKFKEGKYNHDQS